MLQFEPDEVPGLGEGQNTTLHPMADRARADLEVLRHLCSRPPLLLRLHGFDCCIFRHANMFLRLGGRGRWRFDHRQTPQLLHHIRDDGLRRLVRRLQCHLDAFQAGAGGCPRAIFCARQVDRIGLPGDLQRCNDFLSGVLDNLLLGSRRSLKPRVVEMVPPAVPVALGADFVVDAAKWMEE